MPTNDSFENEEEPCWGCHYQCPIDVLEGPCGCPCHDTPIYPPEPDEDDEGDMLGIER